MIPDSNRVPTNVLFMAASKASYVNSLATRDCWGRTMDGMVSVCKIGLGAHLQNPSGPCQG